MQKLDGKVGLVTGGSRGIGAAIATRLAADGADIAITYNTAKDRADDVLAAVAVAGGRGVAIQANAADHAAISAAVTETVERLGRLDILVNNAGLFISGEIGEATVDHYDELMAVHARAVFSATRAAVEHLPDGGRIVSIGSSLADRVPAPGYSLYAMSKSALIGFTKGVARDLGPRGITVNLVQPGSIDTEMNPADGDHADGERAVTALGHYGTAEDIAATVAHLVGDSGRYITGATVTVDGGVTA
ncbi:NAD(P)-dependent dehydrogenase (short-subunit alcohol dehydrogenase family) [Herbihabitans rhizosphaerae]|uniref:NAD(P)-dependent dehydrogenase (Short-subunit alcohol dehydrogenase family) n=1 Tax=Herbihabitans rhizosphaerae TaxID=1872711 RepID=A0A4Q7KKV8_9PSEU|nr:SDR family oxidoreductase [Herbihabitans rhizosphaerae]RZS36856.1 NAD(P)-dependent dehydrogenase (short-subunit alcohol dehydrogenase family) [Herbihabitans rhizosphaerae]